MRVVKKADFPFCGGSYRSRSRNVSASRSINLYPELSGYDGVGGKNNDPAALFSRSGLRQVQEIGLGPIRPGGQYTMPNATLAFFVSGNEVYQLSASGGIPVLLVGNLNTSTGAVQMTDNGLMVLIVDGVNGYYIDISGSTPTLVQIVDDHFYDGAKTCTYIGGYFVLEEAGTSNFFFSNPDMAPGSAWPALNQASVDSSPDIMICVIANNQQLYLLGTRTIEVWSQSGASASEPFSPIPGSAQNIGCISPASVYKLAGTFFWLGQNDQGGAVLYSFENGSPTRVSNHGIEYELQTLGANLNTASAVAWQEFGHQFYALNVPGLNTTYVYDMTTKQFSEAQTMTQGSMGRFAANAHCFLQGEHIVGDYRDGRLYVLDPNYKKDGDEILRRQRVTPHSSNGVAQGFYKELQIDMQVGNGSLTVNPRVALEMSDDGGYTWGNAIYADSGLVGQYLWRCWWQQLGFGRDVVFRITCDDEVDVVFLNAYLSIEEGTS